MTEAAEKRSFTVEEVEGLLADILDQSTKDTTVNVLKAFVKVTITCLMKVTESEPMLMMSIGMAGASLIAVTDSIVQKETPKEEENAQTV